MQLATAVGDSFRGHFQPIIIIALIRWRSEITNRWEPRRSCGETC
jgi:hypothetical protein